MAFDISASCSDDNRWKFRKDDHHLYGMDSIQLPSDGTMSVAVRKTCTLSLAFSLYAFQKKSKVVAMHGCNAKQCNHALGGSQVMSKKQLYQQKYIERLEWAYRNQHFRVSRFLTGSNQRIVSQHKVGCILQDLK